jgi:DNA polymerase-3 subunit beta
MAGVLWELEGDQVRLVATDGRRLAVAQGSATPHDDHDTNGQTHVVPTKAAKLLERILSDRDEQVCVSLGAYEALFKTERTTIYSRLVEGRYPAYRDTFPKKQTVQIPLSVGSFYTAVRQATIATDEESKRVTFRFASKKLTMQARSETNEATIEMLIDYEGGAIDIAFDPKFLTSMLKVLRSEDSLILELVDRQTAGLFRHGDDYFYLVFPMT